MRCGQRVPWAAFDCQVEEPAYTHATLPDASTVEIRVCSLLVRTRRTARVRHLSLRRRFHITHRHPVAPIAVQGPARCQECFEDRNCLHDTRIRRAAGFYLLSSSSSRMSTASPTLSHRRPSLTTAQHAESWA